MQVLDASSVRQWAERCAHNLRSLRADIDNINVYPVADSDTGSNMLHTVFGALDELDRAQQPPAAAGPALDALARGAVRAARGNSGVILAQMLRGIAESAPVTSPVDGPAFAEALGHADSLAASAVARPVSGTMLTVLHAAAAAARDELSADLAEVAAAAAEAASAALSRTPLQLPVLAEAGVVDAGGRGLLAVLDALVAVLSPASDAPVLVTRDVAADVAERSSRWEVMYLLDDVPDSQLGTLRAELAQMGDSVTVADDGAGTHAVHVHCADIGAALEAGMDCGRPYRVRVEPLPPSAGTVVEDRPRRGVVVLVHSATITDIVRREGVGVLDVPAGATPELPRLRELIAQTAGEHVTVLAADAELTAVADEAAAPHGPGERDVVVVPCVSPVQVLAALAVHDPGRRANDDVVAMAEAAAATRRGELRVASEESLTWVGTAHAGAIVGLVDGEVVLIEQEVAAEEALLRAATTVIGRMLALGGELVTVLTAEQAPSGIDSQLRDWVAGEHPEVEFVSYPGGQEDAVLLIGVE